jgi:hypothetical protein
MIVRNGGIAPCIHFWDYHAQCRQRCRSRINVYFSDYAHNKCDRVSTPPIFLARAWCSNWWKYCDVITRLFWTLQCCRKGCYARVTLKIPLPKSNVMLHSVHTLTAAWHEHWFYVTH